MDHPWDRQPRESSRAYAYFVAYRDMGPQRSLAGVRQTLGEGSAPSRGRLGQLSVAWSWVERSSAWDAHVARQRDRAAADTARKGDRLRQASLARSRELASDLRAKLAEIIDGLDVARADWPGLMKLACLAVDLEQKACAAGMAPAEDFDPEGATMEHLEAYIARCRSSRR
jgi:hypothetical protein